tara:strand:- start:2210 stop:2545 length:336 start_codon:yes stop_codon:yes gene_type:complete
MNDKEFDKAIEQQKWIFAKTYAKKSPHEYFMKRDNPELFYEIEKRIAEKGETIMYFTTPFQCYIRNGKRYWSYDMLVNRGDNNLNYDSKNKEKEDYTLQNQNKNRKLEDFK